MKWICQRSVTKGNENLCIIFIVLSCLSTFGDTASVIPEEQNISVSSFADRNAVNLGDTVVFTVTVKWTGNDFQVKEVSPPLCKNFEIAGSSNSSESKGNATLFEYRFMLKPLIRGDGRIGEVVVDYLRVSAGTAGVLKTAPLYVSISPSQRDKGKLLKTLLMIFSGAGIVIAIAVYLYFKYREKREYERVRRDQETEKLTPEQGLEKSLKVAQDFWDKNDAKEFCSLISNGLMKYLNERYGVTSTEVTVSELVGILGNEEKMKPIKENVREILNFCDMTKFAMYQPTGPEASRIVGMVREIINQDKSRQEEIKRDEQRHNGD